MRKIAIIFIIIIALSSLLSCTTGNEYEEKAKEFLDLYYSQYEKQGEIKEIFSPDEDNSDEITEINDGFYHDEIIEEKIEEFIDTNFREILSIKYKSNLISNREIPNIGVIDSDISKARVLDIEFVGSDGSKESTLSFNVIISYQHIDGENTEFEQSGKIRLIKDGDDLKVDSFRLNKWIYQLSQRGGD